jgi:hypothetical protein
MLKQFILPLLKRDFKVVTSLMDDPNMILLLLNSSTEELDDERLSKVTLFSVAVALKRKLNGKAPPIQFRPESRAKKNWKRALSLIRGPR